MTNIMQKAHKMGYQIVLVMFRASGGMPVQSDKAYCMVSWRDLKEPSDYIFEKYCRRQGRRMYLWGVSLGAVISTQYMIHDDENSPYSALVCYAAPFCPDESMDAFKKKGYGIYDFFLGFCINMKVRGLMDQM